MLFKQVADQTLMLTKRNVKNQENAPTDSPLTTHHSPGSGEHKAQKLLQKLAQRIFILPIRLYQATLSPLLGTHCRHVPSCSQYAIDAISEWGVLKGIWLGIKRIARCHPWGTSGYDPVPKKNRRS